MKAQAFLGDVRGRLLPASVPMRFFGAAVVFQVLAWLTLVAGPMPSFDAAAGLGWPLAALHLLTLGVLGMTAMGAGTQLLPVATRQAVPPAALLNAIWALYAAGVAVLALGMGRAQPAVLAAGGGTVAVSFAAWGMLMLRQLLGARGMPGVVAHAWAALAALALLLASGLALAGTWLGLPSLPRASALSLHVIFAPFGFMGMLTLGLSYILVPMFAVADAPPQKQQLASCALAVTALVLAGAAALSAWPRALGLAAWVLGTAAIGLHLKMMVTVMRSGLRRALGRSFVLVRIGWTGLLATLVLAAGVVLDVALPRLQAAFVLCMVGIWLLSFVLGVLERIVPFLASMHAAGSGRRAPTPSALTHEGWLRLHFGCHVIALAGLAAAIALDSAPLARVAAAVGMLGALGFAMFFGVVLLRLRATHAAAQAARCR